MKQNTSCCAGKYRRRKRPAIALRKKDNHSLFNRLLHRGGLRSFSECFVPRLKNDIIVEPENS